MSKESSSLLAEAISKVIRVLDAHPKGSLFGFGFGLLWVADRVFGK